MLRTTPLLRDAALWALLLAGIGMFAGAQVEAAALGAAACVLNLFGLRWVVGQGGAALWLRLGLKLPLVAGALLFLSRVAEPLGLVLGFGSTLLVLAVRPLVAPRSLEVG